MSFAERQARVRVMEVVEARAKRFRSSEDLWPIRVPREPLSLEELVRQALPGGHVRFDVRSLRARTLLHLEWDDGSAWQLWVMVLSSGLKVFCDTGWDESRVLASGGRHSSDETDRLFLEVLAESGGERFGIEMSGGAPAIVRSSLPAPDRRDCPDYPDCLVEFFVHLFEVTGTEASVREQLQEAGLTPGPGPGGTDFRDTVASWLEVAASKGGKRGAAPLG